MPHTLLIQLIGPMQSWGFRSRFDNRDTGLEPTRSGVVGLLCAALGKGRDTDLSEFDSLVMGVRIDSPGRVAVDYHTAQPIWREGPDSSTVVSDRYYLADARFLVGLQSEDVNQLLGFEAALKNPVWPLFLGRKAFTPSVPIHFPDCGIREGTVQTVLTNEPWHYFSARELRESAKNQFGLRLVLEADAPTHGVATNDMPRDFERRRYGVRYLYSKTIPLTAEQKKLHPVMDTGKNS